MTGVELDFVVKDSLGALSVYERIFEVERVEVTSFPTGRNEAVFTIYGTRFHMLDENAEYQLYAPKPGETKSFWINVTIPDINATFNAAVKAGCTVVMPITEMPGMGVSNALFADPFGYAWMLHQIHREVSFEERVEILRPNES